MRELPRMNSEERLAYLEGVKNSGELGPGWFDLIFMINKMVEAVDPEYVIEQVKEKFGGLRYYLDSKIDEKERMLLYRVVHQMQSFSLIICEQCGLRDQTVSTGKAKSSGRVLTLCSACRENS